MERLLSIKEVSKMLCVHENTLTLWDKKPNSELHAIRTAGGHRRWRLSDVNKLMGNIDVKENVEEENN